jgi:aminopeptidase N
VSILASSLLGPAVLLAQLEPSVLDEARRIAAIEPAEHPYEAGAVDVFHYDLAVAIDPAARRIEGRATITFRVAGEARRELALDAAGVAIRADSSGEARLGHRQEGATLAIDLGREAVAGEEIRLSVEYEAAPRRGLVFVSGPDLDRSMVWSQGECRMSSAWFPCHDTPDDRATSELAVTVPDAWRSVSNGNLVASEPGADGRRTDRWRMDVAIPAYLVSLAAGPFVEIDLGRVRDVPLLAYATAARAAAAAHTLQPTGAMLEMLERFSGSAYPFAAYRQACVAEFPYGGMENAAATTLADDELVLQDASDGERIDAEALVVHELAHQWFGDLVTPRSWRDLWLSEGFATFAEPLWLEENGAHDEAVAAWATLGSEAVEHRGEEPRPLASSRWVEPDDVFDATVYESGACFLRLLRGIVGRDAFGAGVRAWIAGHRGAAVSSEDFERTMSAAAGRDLSPLFRQFVHSPGQPEIEFAWSFDEAAGRLELRANQKQEGDGVPPAYRVPVDVAWHVGDERRTARMELDSRRSRLVVECEAAPGYVRFNDGALLCGELSTRQSTAAWREQLVRDADPFGRIEAAGELARAWPRFGTGPDGPDGEHERRLAMAVLCKALLEDRSVPVRRAAAEALGEIRGELARAALSCALWDVEPRVGEAACEALAAFTDDDPAAIAILERLELERDPKARAMLVETLGAIGQMRAHAMLLEILDDEESPAVLRGAALAAAAGIESAPAEALKQVAERAARHCGAGAPKELRLRAIEALGTLAARSGPARDALTAQLFDPSLAIVGAALEALAVESVPPEVLPELVRFHAAAAFPDQRSHARELIAGLLEKIPQ